MDVFGASNRYAGEGDNPILDQDLDDPDGYEEPDPGLLEEKNESFSEALPRLFINPLRWQNLTLRARARQLWLLLRIGLHDVVEKVWLTLASALRPLSWFGSSPRGPQHDPGGNLSAPLGGCTACPNSPYVDYRPVRPIPQEKRAELSVARLTHGLEPLRRLEVAAGLCSVAQDPVGRRFVALDRAGWLHLHREDGWAREKLLAPVALTGLVAVLGPLGTVGRFVGWGPAGLAILRPDLSLLWLSQPGGLHRAPGREPICCLPVPDLGLLLVAEAGDSLALWKFRSGGRRLVQHRSPLQLPPSPMGALTRLALGPLPPDDVLCCFAACGSAVLTFNLHTWALIDVQRDLHKTTISDLAYCAAAEVMVTASWDSTVKVWESDWQIRMVFVGHTGPVTAIAVLPNTFLVLSASQDRTLRTWDLQAAAQVGEVALCCWVQDMRFRRVNRLLAPAGPGWPVLSLRESSLELWRLRELYSPLAQLSAPVLHLQMAPPLPAPPHPPLPARLVCACADGAVYLVSVATGRTVSALLLEPNDCAAAVAYCLPREQLWLLTRAGHLVCANAARCPMRVLHRVCPPPPPARRPCCLHLYSHLIDPSSAFAIWEIVRQRGGELCRSDMAWAWKDKNRYLPVVGYTDGTLSVLEWRSSNPVFHTEAHNPSPVTAIASTWNSVVSSGGDLTVKVWRVFPYAEESLSLLRSFSCCHPAVVLCALGQRITVGFEDPDSATYGLVQFGLGNSPRYDHRPQDDPMDHITGLCCCPTLKLYACSSLDCTIRIWTAENRLLRLLQLNGAPQALTFCSNSGDLVLALGSRLCLVSHMLYLPTSYLVKKLCRKAPDVVDDPPLPLTGQESLTSAQLQQLANLHRAASVSTALSFIHHQTAAPQQPVLEEDFEALVSRDRDLRQLRLGLVVPVARPLPSWQQRQEAFDNYLRLIYGPVLLGIHSERESQECSIVTLAMERETCDVCTLPRVVPSLGQAGVCTDTPTALPPQGLGALGRGFARPPRITLPIPPILRRVHSMASQIPLLQKRRPRELLSNLGGFFPATIQSYKYLPRPIRFPGCVPNSAVLQRMWLPWEVGRLGALAQLTSRRRRPKPRPSLDSLWQPWVIRRRHAKEHQKQIQWLEEEEEEEEEQQDLDLDWASDSLSPHGELSESEEPEAQSSEDLTPKPTSSQDTAAGTETYYGHSFWEERYGHLPSFLHFFVSQNWFKKLFPIFTLEAYPEVGTVEGLASLLTDLLKEASWADRVYILQALLRLLPDMSKDLCSRLQGILLRLLNLDQPPSFEDRTQKHFVMLALQVLMACSMESREAVLELMSFFLYSPASCQPELKKLLDALGLQDPQGFLFKDMMTWVHSQDLDSKATLRKCCCQKLEEMIQQLQMEILQLSEMPSKISETSALPSPPKEGLSQISMVSGMPIHISVTPSVQSRMSSLVVSPGEPNLATPEGQAQQMLSQLRVCPTRRRISEILPHFSLPGVHLHSLALATLPNEPLPLEQTRWSQVHMLDLETIDALNFFCKQQARQQSSLPETKSLRPSAQLSLYPQVPNTVVPQPRDQRHYPFFRLQEGKVQGSPMRLKGQMVSRLWAGRTLDGPIRMLKLPLPRVELQPFPPGWPRPARPLPPLLLQPTLQRYFLPDNTDPGSYS
nr:WD repeat-containing protein 97 isoform X4 [Equus caballus]